MKRGSNKSLIFLSIFVLVILLGLILINAQTRASGPTDNVLARWFRAAFTDADAKLLFFIISFVLVLTALIAAGMSTGSAILISAIGTFIFTGFVTPTEVLAIMKTYKTLPLLLNTMLPILALFVLTYLGVRKRSRVLLTIQLFFWIGFLILNLTRIFFAMADYYAWTDAKYLKWSEMVFGTLPTPEESINYWTAIGIQTFLAFFMVFGNTVFLKWVLRITYGIDKANMEAFIDKIELGGAYLGKVGEVATEGGK